MEIVLKKNLISIKSNNIVGFVGDKSKELIIKLTGKSSILNKNVLKDGRIKKINYNIINSSNIKFYCNKVKSEIKFYCKKNKEKKSIVLKKINQYLELLNLKNDIFFKNISDLSDSEKYRLYILLNIVFYRDVYIFINCTRYLDKNNIKSLRNVLKNKEAIILFLDDDINNIYYLTDNVFIYNSQNVIYDSTKKVLTNVDLLKREGIQIPELPLITYLAKEKKNIKLFYHDDVRDIIKDIYKHV